MAERYQVAIIGSGPGGLSAAITAAREGMSHILLERTAHLSDTIFKYQKGKKVMAHPLRLPLQGALSFDEGRREDILATWNQAAAEAGIVVRYNAEIVAITGTQGAFSVTTAAGDVIEADHVVLAIGLQGNLRKLTIEGADREWVQYQLDDPDDYQNERIVVIGAGDAAIENAVALAVQNDVSIINRQPDIARAKPGNIAAIERLTRSGAIRAYHGSSPVLVGDQTLAIDTPEGRLSMPCDRIIARLGAIPPRKFLESCGIAFPSKDPAAVPELSATYETNVKGLYLIGALAGYTLIKQAINQGYEVIQRLAGNPVEPADQPLLRQRFAKAFPDQEPDAVLAYIRERVPVFAGLTLLQLREVMLESEITRFAPGDRVFRRGDYSSTLWNIAEGAVGVVVNEERLESTIRIGPGEFFGEMGLLSGRRRTAGVIVEEPSVLVETPRRTMRRLQNSVEAVKAELDRVAVRRLLHTSLARDLPVGEIADVIAAAELRRYKPFEVVVSEGDPVDALFIMRTGSATISRMVNGHETVLRYITANTVFGERGLLDDGAVRAATIRATVASEAIRVDAEVVRQAIRRLPRLRAMWENAVQDQLESAVRTALANVNKPASARDTDAITSFLAAQGVGEATNAFIIDESICTRCDNCEKACAATHDGISRISREAGTGAISILLPVACRHCENPHCMSDCPVDAITRAATGEVFINQLTCIGCSNCANNCPYGAINMVDPADGAPAEPGWLQRLLQGVGLAPIAKAKLRSPDAPHEKKAVKCDLCKSTGNPACVDACPTGAAIRVSPEAYFGWLHDGKMPDRAR